MEIIVYGFFGLIFIFGACWIGANYIVAKLEDLADDYPEE